MSTVARGIFAALLAVSGVTSCAKNGEQEPAQDATNPAYTQQTYGQPTAYPQSTYGQPAYTQPASTAATPTATATPMVGGLQCQSDATCVTHRCNTATGYCAFPCQTNDDCQAGNQCMPPVCVPAGFAPAQ